MQEDEKFPWDQNNPIVESVNRKMDFLIEK